MCRMYREGVFGGHIGILHLASCYLCEFLVRLGLISATTSYPIAMRLIQCANSDLIPPEVGARETSGFRGPRTTAFANSLVWQSELGQKPPPRRVTTWPFDGH